ncbi:MAG: sugar ABC transporter permease [Deltaproteobacteria bacterium]|nr:sugar ABC transporter permease [Deltaproteobacteria bacterium]
MTSRWLPYILILPAVTIVAGTLLLPCINVVVMSFSEWYLFAHRAGVVGHPFVGLKNYIAAFSSFVTWQALKNTLIFVIACVVIEFSGGLAAALLLNEKFRGRSIARTLSLIPFAIPAVPWALAWVVMLYFDGIVNHILMKLGLLNETIAWLGNSKTALPAVILVRAFKLVPFVQVMLLAGLSAIPEELYEAAKVDGAPVWRRFCHITLPLLKPVTLVTSLILAVWHINDFAIVWVMTQGGPSNATELIVMNAYKVAFEAFRFGESSAIGVVLLIFSLIFGFLYLKSTKAFE